MYTVGIDIGGTSLRIGLIDKQNNLLHFEKVPQADILKKNAPERLAEFIGQYIHKHKAENNIAAVCAVFPAAVDKERAVVLNAPNINGFNGVNVKAVLSEKLKYPVFIEKDTNALLYYDLYRHKADESGVIIGVYAGTGLGNAVLINGKLLTGANGVAGELGHIPAWDYKEICACGNTGCAESGIGGKYLDKLCLSEFPNTSVGEIFQKHGGHPLLVEYTQRLAAVIAAEINILDPDTVILGGGVVSMQGFPCDSLTKYIRGYARKPLPEANLKFIFSKNNGENGVVGAGIYAWNQIVASLGTKIKIAIGNDHTALEMKKEIGAYLAEKGYEVINVGTDSAERCDYPVYGIKTAKEVASGRADLGIVICGTGVGISIAANKVKGIRAVVCSEPYSAMLSRQHNNTNILAFGARVVGIELAKTIVDSWLSARFEGGRHQKRVDMLEET